MNPEEILITDYHCASNRGDAAILEGELAVLKKEFPQSSFTVMTEYPDAAELIHDSDVKVAPQRLPPFKPYQVMKNMAIGFCLFNSLSQRITDYQLPLSSIVNNKLALQPYYDADLVIATGGQYLTDIYFPSKIALLAEWSLLKLLGKPVIIYAQSIGPFEREPYRSLSRSVLNQVDLIVTRDSQSKTHLDELGVTETLIHVGTDAAFAMPLDTEKRPLEKKIGTDFSIPSNPEGPTVSISTRRWSHFETEDGEDQFESAVADVATYLIESRNAEIVFVSTCTGLAGYHTDDRVSAHRIIDRMDNDIQERTSIVSNELTPQQLVDIYAQIDLHIGTRMHSNILSMLGGTPFVAISYQFKTEGLVERIGLEDYLVDIDGLSTQELRSVVQRALDNQESLEEKIEVHCSDLRETAQNDAHALSKFLSQSNFPL